MNDMIWRCSNCGTRTETHILDDNQKCKCNEMYSEEWFQMNKELANQIDKMGVLLKEKDTKIKSLEQVVVEGTLRDLEIINQRNIIIDRYTGLLADVLKRCNGKISASEIGIPDITKRMSEIEELLIETGLVKR